MSAGPEAAKGTDKATISPERWEELIRAAMHRRPAAVRAETYRRVKWQSFTSPVLLAANDGVEYAVKGQDKARAEGKGQAPGDRDRSIANEQIVGRLAHAIGAPVPETRLVDVPAELIRINPDLQHMPPGLSHGSRSLWPDCTERLWLEHAKLPANRTRFALLAVLYGWVHSGDHQLLYRKKPPELVFSVDHGHFFPGGPSWTVEALNQVTPVAPEQTIMTSCAITREELGQALKALALLGPETIAEAVAAPPEEWCFSLAHRVAAAQYLDKPRTALIEQAPVAS